MNALCKAIISVGLRGGLSACAYDPATGGYYSASDNYYGQGYRQSSSYGYPNSGYSSNGYSGYRQPAYGYGNFGYPQSPYGYSGNQQRPYCPDDDDD